MGDSVYRGGCGMSRHAWMERELRRARESGTAVAVCGTTEFETLSLDGDGVVLPPAHPGYERRVRTAPAPLSSVSAQEFVDIVFRREEHYANDSYWYIAPRQVLLDVFSLAAYDAALFTSRVGRLPAPSEECALIDEVMTAVSRLVSGSGQTTRPVSGEAAEKLASRYPKRRFENIARILIGNSAVTAGCIVSVAGGALETFLSTQARAASGERPPVVFVLSDLLGASAALQASLLLRSDCVLFMSDAHDAPARSFGRRIFTRSHPSNLVVERETWGPSPDARDAALWVETLAAAGFKSVRSLPVESPDALDPLDYIVRDAAKGTFRMECISPDWTLRAPARALSGAGNAISDAMRDLDKGEEETEHAGALRLFDDLERAEREKKEREDAEKRARIQARAKRYEKAGATPGDEEDDGSDDMPF